MSRTRFLALDSFFLKGEVVITEEGYSDLILLADIVVSKHFYLNSDVDKDDLRSTGILKALTLLQKGEFDPKRSSLKNYLYTGMRNEMKNYLYRKGRELLVEKDVLVSKADTSSSIDLDFTTTNLEIGVEFIRGCIRTITEAELAEVATNLSKLGFMITGEYERKGGADQCRVEMMECVVIWRHLVSCRH